MRPYLFKIGGFELRIYSLMYILAFLFGMFICLADDVAENRGDFVGIENGWHSAWSFCHLVLKVFDLPFQHMLVNKNDRAQRLILCAWAHASIDCKVI